MKSCTHPHIIADDDDDDGNSGGGGGGGSNEATFARSFDSWRRSIRCSFLCAHPGCGEVLDGSAELRAHAVLRHGGGGGGGGAPAASAARPRGVGGEESSVTCALCRERLPRDVALLRDGPGEVLPRARLPGWGPGWW